MNIQNHVAIGDTPAQPDHDAHEAPYAPEVNNSAMVGSSTLGRFGRQVLSLYVFNHRYAPHVRAQATALYGVYWTYADKQDPPTCFPSNKTLAFHLKLKDEKSVTKYVKALEEIGVIETRKRRGHKGGQTSNLCVLKPIHREYEDVKRKLQAARRRNSEVVTEEIPPPLEREALPPLDGGAPTPQKGDEVYPENSVHNDITNVMYTAALSAPAVEDRIPIPDTLTLDASMRARAAAAGILLEVEQLFPKFLAFYQGRPDIKEIPDAWPGDRWGRWVQKRVDYLAKRPDSSGQDRAGHQEGRIPIPADFKMTDKMREIARSMTLDGLESDTEFQSYLRKHREDLRFAGVRRTPEEWEGSAWAAWLRNNIIVQQRFAEKERREEAARKSEEAWRAKQQELGFPEVLREITVEDRYL